MTTDRTTLAEAARRARWLARDLAHAETAAAALAGVTARATRVADERLAAILAADLSGTIVALEAWVAGAKAELDVANAAEAALRLEALR